MIISCVIMFGSVSVLVVVCGGYTVYANKKEEVRRQGKKKGGGEGTKKVGVSSKGNEKI